jgi:hypothetical protein
MYCPKCGSTQSDDLRFCKQCGSNLAAVRMAVDKPEAVEDFDWSKTWLAEMFLSHDEKDRLKGVTPEMKRLREIKAGVITASVGVAVTILLFVLMNGIIASGRASDAAAEILSRIWVAGLIPIFVGAALIFNGMIVSRRAVDRSQPASPDPQRGDTTQLGSRPEFLPPADTNELFPAGFSVTDETTRHLDRDVSATKQDH